MDGLNIFLKALHNIKKCDYIPRTTIEHSGFGSLFKCVVEVWCIEDGKKYILTSANTTCDINDDENKQAEILKLKQEVIEKILRMYGIQ